MEYNTKRERINISSYGRNIQKIVEYAVNNISDKEERTKFCYDVVSTMANNRNINREGDDFQKKLWNHLYIISDFKLDVDFPFKKQKREELILQPSGRLNYPKKKKYNKGYGVFVKHFLGHIGQETDMNVRSQTLENIANYMKRAYYRVNNVVPDEGAIRLLIASLSDDTLKLDENFKFSNNVMNARKKKPPKNQSKPQQKKNFGSNNGGYKKR